MQRIYRLILSGWILLLSWGTTSWADSPLPAPRSFLAASGDTQVLLDWEAVAGAVSYRVKRAATVGGASTVVVSNLVGTSFTVTNLVNGSVVFFTVSAQDDRGEGMETVRLRTTPSAPVLDWLPAGAKVERLATGFQFVEGPVWVPADGGYLVFSDIPANRLYRWRLGGLRDVFRANSGQANGNTLDREGRLITCEHANRRVSRTEADGTVITLANRYNNRAFNAPNDVAVKSDGTTWFTDPDYGLGAMQPGRYVYRFDPALGSNSVVTVVTNFDQPNGICFSPDETRLYIADSGGPHHIRVFDVLPGNTLTNSRVFKVITPGAPDGMRTDAAGRLWTSAGDGAQIYDTNGALLGKITTPETAANLGFGGTNREMLFITAGTSLYGITRKPDLIVTAIQRAPNTPAAGQATTFSVVVKNQGTGATPAGVATRVALTIGTLTNWVWSDGFANPIPPDGSVVLDCDAGVAGGVWIATPGTHTLRAVVDDVRRFTESNVSNNTFSASLIVAEPPPDTDSDGLSDADEILAGTDPQNAASVLRILSARLLSDGAVALAWSSVAAKTYRLACKSNLSDPSWTDLADVIPSQGETTTWTNRPASAGSVFLRVRVGP